MVWQSFITLRRKVLNLKNWIFKIFKINARFILLYVTRAIHIFVCNPPKSLVNVFLMKNIKNHCHKESNCAKEAAFVIFPTFIIALFEIHQSFKGQFLNKLRVSCKMWTVKRSSSRSSHRRCSMKKGVLRNFSKFTGKNTCARFSFLIKLETWGLQLY